MSHIMLHSGTLANEFNDILNGVEIFAPFQPLDPAVTFYAPLRTSVRDLRLNQDDFQRASDAWYKDGSGIYRNVGINRARFEESRLLMEPAQTNKCQGYNANPDDAFTNLTKTGDAAAVLSRVYDPAALAAAGLSDICPSGFVIRLDNSAGATTAHVNDTGVFGNTNTHTISAWCRKLAGANITSLRNSGNNFIADFDNADFERIVAIGQPGGVNQNLRIACQAGTVADFVLQQMEESPVVTSPIVTEGAAGQRAIDSLSYLNADSFFTQAQGMALATVIPRFDKAEQTERDALLSLITSKKQSLLYYDAVAFRSTDETTVISLDTPAFVSNDEIKVALLYGPSGPTARQLGYSLNGAAWVWSPAGAYDGAFLSDNEFIINFLNIAPKTFSEVYLYNENKGTVWVEGNY